MASVQTLGSAEGSIEINEATEESVCMYCRMALQSPLHVHCNWSDCPADMDVVGLNFSAVSAKQVMAIPSGISSRDVPCPYGFVASTDARVTLFFLSQREGIVT